MSVSIFIGIAKEVQIFLGPLLLGVDSRINRKLLLKLLGISADLEYEIFENKFLSFLSVLKNLNESLNLIIENPEFSLENIKLITEKCKNLTKEVKKFKELFVEPTGDLPEVFRNIEDDILDLLLSNYLNKRYPILYSICVLLTIIEDIDTVAKSEILIDSNGNIRFPYKTSKIKFDQISELIKDPFKILGMEYGTVFYSSSTVPLESGIIKFYQRLGKVLDLLKVQYHIGVNIDDEIEFDQELLDIAPTLMSLYCQDFVLDIDMGITIGVSGPAQGDLGIVIIPFGNWVYSNTKDNIKIDINSSGSFQALAIKNQKITWDGDQNNNFSLEASIEKKFDSIYSITTSSSSGLKIGEIKLTGKLSFKTENSINSIISYFQADIKNTNFTIQSNDGDGFLQKVLPPNGLKIDIEFGIGFDSAKGFFVSGGVGFNYRKKTNINILGFLIVETIIWNLKSTNNNLNSTIGIDGKINLGPITATISEIGVKANISPNSNAGNLGPFDVSFSFKPPNGIGINIDTDAVKGGGYLYINTEEGRYAGVAGLSIKDKIKLSAFGLINTKFPDGRKGYSFLIFISSEFTPIQLGFGFTLNGVGGLVGIHRSTNMDKLREGVKTKAYDNLLFPQNPVENALEIISSLEAIFPVSEGRYVFGIMGKIGWGSPTLITIDLGLIIEVPNPVKLAILGVVKAILPDEDKAILKLQVNFLGVIDFGKKQLSFDASIYDSRLLSFSLAGDMAMRLSWGDNANFLMSVGGFHPSYQPPPQLVSMKRMTLNLLGGDNPRLTLTCYFAVTSNTVQFGSKVDLYVKVASKLTAEGYMGFDALFQMNPFYMKILAYAYLAIKWNGDEKFSISLAASLEGPKPWNVDGVAEVKVLCFKYKVKVQKKWGANDNAALPPVPVKRKLVAALESIDNWGSVLPVGKQQLVTLRKIDVVGKNILLPEGILTVSQKVLPLNLNIQLFGTQDVSDGGLYSISKIEIDGEEVTTKSYVKEDFVPAHFRKMSETEKLSGPSFQKYDGGIRIDGMNELQGSDIKSKEIKYETIVYDPVEDSRTSKGSILENDKVHAAMLKGSKAGQSALSASKDIAPLAPKSISVKEEEYGVVKIADMSLVDTDAICASYTEAQDYYQRKVDQDISQKTKLKIVPKFEILTA